MNKEISKVIYKKIEESKKISTFKPDLSKSLGEEAYKMSIEHGLKIEEGYSLVSLAFASRVKSEIKEMLNLSYKALQIFEEENDVKGRIRAMNLIGIAYFYSSMYEESLRYLTKVADLLNHEDDDFMLCCVLNNIGEVYRESQKYEQALDYYNKAISISEDCNYEKINASIYGNIGEVYYSKKMYEESLEVLEKSYEILLNHNDMVSLGETENRIGKVYYEIGDYIKANNYYINALDRLINIDNKYYIIDVYINLAKLKEIEESKEAIKYYEKALNHSENINAKKKTTEVFKALSELYELLGDYKLALEYYKKHSNINKEIMASHLGNKLEILNIEIENTKESNKYNEIKRRLEKEIELQKEEITKIKKTNETLFNKAYEDELTGIPNRRSVNSYLKKILSDEIYRDENIGLLMIDIDHFKKYNDYWGHPKGDICLKEIAAAINNIQKDSRNIFGRYGGEEFVYILRDKNELNVEEMGNKIKGAVEGLNQYYISKNNKCFLTVSVGGVYGKISDFDKFSNLMELADKELYLAKNLGRNKSIVKNVNEID